MHNYLSVTQHKDRNTNTIKFNVSENLAKSTLLPELRKWFSRELQKGKVSSKNKRVIIELIVNDKNAAIIRKAFVSQLPIFENQN